MKENILLIGAGGQLGLELAAGLSAMYHESQIFVTDIKDSLETPYRYQKLNVLDILALSDVIQENKITQIYHLAAILSAAGEKNPAVAWDINMNGLLNVLNMSVSLGVKKVFWPSSIAVFGPNTPRIETPQHCVMDPNTMYGITKLAGERLCEYYFQKKGLDVRSLRYPGLISWSAPPGGGTTDYAVHIFHEALKHQKYTCFLGAESELPMLYMPDAVKATIDLMHAEPSQLTIRSSYNLAGMSFTPAQIAAEIQTHIPKFMIDYAPDFRQAIADSWPCSIDDSQARKDWQWKPSFDLSAMTSDMLAHLSR